MMSGRRRISGRVGTAIHAHENRAFVTDVGEDRRRILAVAPSPRTTMRTSRPWMRVRSSGVPAHQEASTPSEVVGRVLRTDASISTEMLARARVRASSRSARVNGRAAAMRWPPSQSSPSSRISITRAGGHALQ